MCCQFHLHSVDWRVGVISVLCVWGSLFQLHSRFLLLLPVPGCCLLLELLLVLLGSAGLDQAHHIRTCVEPALIDQQHADESIVLF